MMNIKNNYQYIKPLSAIAVISLILFCSGCNQLLQEYGILPKPATETAESLNPESLNPEPLKTESCQKTRGFIVKGHEEKEQKDCKP